MKSYTLDKLTEARDALLKGDQLTTMSILNKLIEKYKLMLKPYVKPKKTQELDYGDNTGTERKT